MISHMLVAHKIKWLYDFHQPNEVIGMNKGDYGGLIINYASL